MDWLHPRNFTPHEKKWIFFYFLTIAGLSTAPYIVFWFLTPAYQQYTWSSVFYYDDYFQYFAWARHIAGGEWLIRNYYTDSPAASFALINPYFLLLGWMTKLIGNVYLAYHLLRIIAIAAFCWISYAFIALFLREARLRRLAQLLMLGGGLEYPYFQWLHSRNPSPLADPYVYKTLYRYGHLTVALCLLLIIFGTYVFTVWRNHQTPEGEEPESPQAALIGLAIMVLGLINPYYLVLIVVVITMHSAWLVSRGFAHPLNLMVAVGLGAVPPFIHYHFQPISSHLGAIAFDDPIGPLDLLLFFGLYTPGAVIAWIRVFRNRSEDRETYLRLSFLPIWALVVAGLTLTPLPFRARMVFGIQIGLSILVTTWMGRGKVTSLIYLPLFLLPFLDAGFTFYKEKLDFQDRDVGRIDRTLLSAFDYIDQHSKPGDVVLTPMEIGNYLPAYTNANTYVGHSFQTENFDAKTERVKQFFRADSNQQRLAFLKEVPARYVLAPQSELNANPEFALPGWNKRYYRYGYAVYERPNNDSPAKYHP